MIHLIVRISPSPPLQSMQVLGVKNLHSSYLSVTSNIHHCPVRPQASRLSVKGRAAGEKPSLLSVSKDEAQGCHLLQHCHTWAIQTGSSMQCSSHRGNRNPTDRPTLHMLAPERPGLGRPNRQHQCTHKFSNSESSAKWFVSLNSISICLKY